MRMRPLVIAGLTAGLALTAVACSSDDSSSGDTTASTGSSVIGNVLPPVILDAEETSATVSVGTVVTFNLGDPDGGRFVAESSDPSVFRVERAMMWSAAATDLEDRADGSRTVCSASAARAGQTVRGRG